MGDVEPEPDASPVGRAMGAMVGRVIGPGSGSERASGMVMRSGGGMRLWLGAMGMGVGDARGLRLGGAMGAGGTSPRPGKSNGLPLPNARGTAEGARGGGGPGGMAVPGIMGTLPTNAPGANGVRGDNAGGTIPTPLTDGGKPGVCGGMCGGICGVIGVTG